MAELMVVSGEALWPPVHGGRLRAARVVEALAARLDVAVVAPAEAPPPPEVALHPLPSRAPLGRVEGFASVRPRLGAVALGPIRKAAVASAVARLRPRAVLFTHSYVAAVVPLGVPFAVDFPDVEVRRQASLARGGRARHRALRAWEAAKARRWEPRVSRRAAVVAASAAADVALLSSWGAHVVHAPNGTEVAPAPPSPRQGPVTFVASFDYAPNAEAARWLVAEVWPRLRSAAPELRLRLVGRAAAALGVRRDGPGTGGYNGVEVVSDPDDVGTAYAEASIVLAPVRTGGGAQLKVTEALARGRLVVATSFSAAAAPPGADGAVIVADDAESTARAVLDLWRDPAARRARERALVAQAPVPSWEEACRPLADALERLVGRR